MLTFQGMNTPLVLIGVRVNEPSMTAIKELRYHSLSWRNECAISLSSKNECAISLRQAGIYTLNDTSQEVHVSLSDTSQGFNVP